MPRVNRGCDPNGLTCKSPRNIYRHPSMSMLHANPVEVSSQVPMYGGGCSDDESSGSEEEEEDEGGLG